MKIRTMIVDDSVVFRGFWAGLLSGQEDIEVSTTAVNGLDAVERIAKREIDLVLLDVDMPEMDGIEAISHLLRVKPNVKIIMASALTTEASKVTIAALTRGAHDYITKPSSIVAGASVDEVKAELYRKIRGLFGGIEKPSPVKAPPMPSGVRRSYSTPKVIAIGASTGGPNALCQVLSNLDPELKLPILIVQHMPSQFTGLLADQLAKDSGRPCREGRNGEQIREGEIYLAPGGQHMKVLRLNGRYVISLTKEEPENFCRPAVDVLFRSVALAYGSRALGLVLTGMGEDGMLGCQNLRDEGATILVQDEASSVVWGMPGAVFKAGFADEALPLGEVAGRVSEICKK